MDLLEALRSYQQADEDGVMVLVSRQACDEAVAEIERLRSCLKSMIGLAHSLADDESGIDDNKVFRAAVAAIK